MAEKQSNKDRLKEITDSIEKGIQELFQSEKYRQYLRTMSRFHKYSVNNTIDISSVVTDLESRLMEMDVGPLLGLWFQSLFVGICTWAITICIFIVIYGRMIEVYLVTSVAPIPMATMANREWGQMGQNYLHTLFALGFQAFLIMVCVAIYSVLVQNISVSTDISTAIWTCMGYTVLLCFTLFKTSSLAKSIFNSH